jgi:hypothetical protein
MLGLLNLSCYKLQPLCKTRKSRCLFACYQGGNRHHVIRKICVHHLWGQVMHDSRMSPEFFLHLIPLLTHGTCTRFHWVILFDNSIFFCNHLAILACGIIHVWCSLFWFQCIDTVWHMGADAWIILETTCVCVCVWGDQILLISLFFVMRLKSSVFL